MINLIDNVASCTFVTKEEALQKFIASHEDPAVCGHGCSAPGTATISCLKILR